MIKNALKIAVLALPIIVMTVLIGVHSHNRENGKEWRIPITVYDPIDPLRGHYLVFRYNWDWQEHMNVSCSGEECAVCLQEKTPSNPINPMVYMTTLAIAEKQCDSFIKGYNLYPNKFKIGTIYGYGLTRYYIPEAEARKLDRLSWDESDHQFDIGLRVNDSGQAFIEQMYIDGIALEEWIKKN